MPDLDWLLHSHRGVAALNAGGMVLLSDDFERDNTPAGDLGDAPIPGQPWDLRGPFAGPYPLPPSSFGQITSGGFVVPGGQTVYAGLLLARMPRSFLVDWSWVDDAVGTQFTTLAIVISNSLTNWVDNMLHVTVTNGVCKIQKRLSSDGVFVDLNAGLTAISPSLALANTVHRIQVDIGGQTVRVRIDDTKYDVTVSDADVPNVAGRRVAVEHFSGSTDVRWPMTIRGVEAHG